MLTLKKVNAELKRLGHAEELVRGVGYFYFDSDVALTWPTSSVYVNSLNQLTLEQWIGELVTMKEQNDSI